MKRVADLIAETLYSHGIRHAFGMPGGEVVTLIDALEKAGIRFLLCRHETAAAFMAAGEAAISGAPGLVVTTLGPGLANAVNGIADASQEHAPLIIISGVVEHGLRSRYTHQILDQAALLQPLVKASLEIEQLGAAESAARALRMALAAPMGPVHLQLAPDTAAQTAPVTERALQPARRLAVEPSPQSEAVANVAALIAQAQRPIIIGGLEAVRSGCGDALLALMEQAQIPLITSYKAKGIVDEHHPLVLGGAGLSPLADKELLPLTRAADLVLLLGYDPIEMRAGWLNPFAAAANIVEISAHPADHAMHNASIEIIADPKGFLRALPPALSTRTAQVWRNGEPAATRDTLRGLFGPSAEWGPAAIFDALQSGLPAEAIVTVDSGAHRILLSQQLLMRRPNALLQSAGFCTMGAAIPLAAGAKLANPDVPVVAVLGDGGLEMGLGELATLRDQQIPITVVVLQDESLALIELKQAQAGLRRAGVGLGKSRFADIADALGGHGIQVNSRDRLEAALRNSLTDSTFTLIVCEIQVSDYVGKF